MNRARLAGTLLAIVMGGGCAEATPSSTPDSPSPAGSPAESPAGPAERNPAAIVEGERYRPQIDPAYFVETIDNPYMPLLPGTTLVYDGTSDGEAEHVEVAVTGTTKEVMGITTTVVRDTVFIDGQIAEDTFDWFAQDEAGNVWYFGEAVKDYKNGEFAGSGGSWEAGVDGALPGIVMLADPRVGDRYRQEYYVGEAVDEATIVALGESVTVPHGSFEDIIITEDVNPLEPGPVEHKYYAPGVGMVKEEMVKGGQGLVELVEIRS